MSQLLESLFSLHGRVALVTGGSSGIGQCMAETLCRAGARVVVISRTAQQLESMVASLRAEGLEAAHVATDLAERGTLACAMERMAEPFGEPDILVHAAGINLRPPLQELSLDDWDRTMRLNLDAGFLLGQRFAPAMARRGWGRIIQIASQQSIRAFGNSGAYGVSKAGIVALMRSQAEAWSRHGVCCNAIAPGFVRTPLTAPLFDDPEKRAALAARTMVGRNGELDDFRGVTLFLASPASSFVTGQVLFVDGGFSVH